jgi:hypothetical protein
VIQVVTDNHAITGTHGTPENLVDFPLPKPPYVRTTPYYSEQGAANATTFYDIPGRRDADKDHTWQADLFLVTGPAIGGAPDLITMYTPGIHWGWKNTCTPRAESGASCVPATPVELASDGPIAPGAHRTATVQLPASLTLTKGTTVATVALADGSLSASIASAVSAANDSEYTLTGGSGHFDPFLFGLVPVGASSFSVIQGNGVISWDSGELSLHALVQVSAPGFPDVTAVADGTGTVDFLNDTISIDPDAMGLESPISPVPSLSHAGLLFLAVLLFAGSWAMAQRGRGLLRPAG